MSTNKMKSAFLIVLLMALPCTFSLAQVPEKKKKPEVTFGDLAPVKGDTFERKRKSDSTVNMLLQGTKTKTKVKEDRQVQVTVLDSMNGGVFAARFKFLKDRNQTTVSAGGETIKQDVPESRKGKTFKVAYAENQLILLEVDGKKSEGKSPSNAHQVFAKELKRLLPNGIVFDAGDERSLPLKGKTFQLGTTYKDLFAQAPEMKAALEAQKLNTKKVEFSGSTKFLRLTKVGGVPCAVLKNKSKLEMEYEQDDLLMVLEMDTVETVTMAIETCWHIKSVSNVSMKMTGHRIAGKKEPVLKLDSKAKLSTTTSFKRNQTPNDKQE